MIHDVLPLTNPEWYSRRFARWYGALVPLAAKQAAAILTVSERSRSEILRVLSTPRQLSIVTQGLEPFDQPADARSIVSVRRKFDLGGPFLLGVRHGDPRKNHEFLLAVRSELERRGEHLELVIVGQVSSRVHGIGSALGDAYVRLLGHVTDAEMQALYSSATALCFPSLAEGFGRPPLEAAACGTPALIADLAAVAEPGRSAGIALPLSAEAWADAVIALARDPAFRAATVTRGREAAVGLSWDTAAAQVLEACITAANHTARWGNGSVSREPRRPAAI
jgi:glycosyltransferase involved in cell wall biosynthesis